MRHTAGFIYDDAPGAHGLIAKAEDPLSLDNSLAQFGAKLARVPLLHDPGEQWSYSAAVDVQALLVEKLTGQRHADYVRDHILLPLGMRETAWAQPATARARLAMIYEDQRGALVPLPEERLVEANFRSKPLTMGGSGLVSTVDEYLRFARMLLGQRHAGRGALAHAGMTASGSSELLGPDRGLNSRAIARPGDGLLVDQRIQLRCQRSG